MCKRYINYLQIQVGLWRLLLETVFNEKEIFYSYQTNFNIISWTLEYNVKK